MLIRGLMLTRPKLHVLLRVRQDMQMNFSAGMSNSSIKISKILREDHQKLSDFLIKNFYAYEPMGVVLELNPEKEVRNWFDKYVKKHLALSPQVSSQAVDASGQLAGVLFSIVVDPRKPRPPLMMDYVDPDTQKVKAQIGRFLDEIEEGIDACELLGLKSIATDNHPKVLDNLMLSINEKYWRRGLSEKLIKKTEEYAMRYKECRAAKVVVTSEFSYKAYLKCEYQMIREFQFENYRDADGVPIFKGKESKLGIHTCGRVMIKQLQ